MSNGYVRRDTGRKPAGRRLRTHSRIFRGMPFVFLCGILFKKSESFLKKKIVLLFVSKYSKVGFSKTNSVPRTMRIFFLNLSKIQIVSQILIQNLFLLSQFLIFEHIFYCEDIFVSILVVIFQKNYCPLITYSG